MDVFDGVVELLEHERDLSERFGIGVLVDAVDHRRLRVAHVSRDRLVRRDHRLLDHVRRDGALAQHDLDGLVVGIEPHLRLDGLEVQTPARHASLADLVRDAGELPQRELGFAIRERLRTREPTVDLVVVAAAVASDDARVELRGFDRRRPC